MKKTHKILLIFGFLFTFLAAFACAFWIAGRFYAPASATGLKADEISAYLEHFFIDDYDEDALADAAATAMVEATGDPWSYYLNAAQYQDYEEMMNNAYVGIGVTISPNAKEGGMRIEEVTPGGPAAEAGVQIGDIMVSVEGKSTLELGTDGTRELVRGQEGTFVQLRFRRGAEEFDLEIERRTIETEVASAEMLEDNIGYIKIANFDGRCAVETLACLEDILQKGAKAMIFDVRFNGGGYKDEMVKILDRLLPEGELFRSVDYSGKEEVDRSDAVCLNIPMAVLVNEDSYSAAEFFAAALQEYEAATIIGVKTTGKGNFQSAFQLSDGSILNISIGKYYTPNGVSLTDTGVTPDIEMDLTDEDYASLYLGKLEYTEDVQLQAALDAMREKIS